ncbi:hypothetical protein LWF01_01590 [Saxibacter everestensis]|uniref:Lipase n=1 Tax=Saxibacter everestensis TaxID=2909229 RepID=A0ABY8QTZ4_9MICO|nr:hypothetical protein LWF01_01590 [Brevibacteriaceae bacterium ZFBP1038]
MDPHYPRPRRRAAVAAFLAAALIIAAALGLPRAVAHSSPSGSAGPVSFTLPAPTGPEQIGTLEMQLVDRGRIDPWAEDGGPRELMINIWYPARHVSSAPPTPYLSARVASYLNQTTGELGIAKDAVDFVGAVSHAQTRAPIAEAGPRPTLIYSPGGGMSRALGTTLVEDLVSHGYVVVTVDSTYQAPAEFPDGLRMPARGVDMKLALAERVRDIRFVIDQLSRLRAGDNPDVQLRSLPAGLRYQLDLDRIGMFGHSMGGFASAETMRADHRVRAGANLDGSMGETYRASTGMPLSGPFLLIGAGRDGETNQQHTHREAPDWASYWSLMTGWKRDLYLPEGEHMSFTDLPSILSGVSADVDLDQQAVRDAIGTVDPDLALMAQRRYLKAFFHLQLSGQPTTIFEHVPAELATTAELIS